MPKVQPGCPLVTRAARWLVRPAGPRPPSTNSEMPGRKMTGVPMKLSAAGHGDAGTRCAASTRHLACIYRPIETGHEGVWVVDAIRVGTKLRARLHCEVCLA